MQPAGTDSDDTTAIKAHLRIALRNGLILLPTVFFFGLMGGWALSHWARSRTAALAGSAVAASYAIWVWNLYYRTRGLLHRRSA